MSNTNKTVEQLQELEAMIDQALLTAICKTFKATMHMHMSSVPEIDPEIKNGSLVQGNLLFDY